MSTPIFPYNGMAPCQGQSPTAPVGPQGPPGNQGSPPALAIGNVTTLAAGSQAAVAVRANPAGGYFIDFGIPSGDGNSMTQAAADARYAPLLPTNGTYRVITNQNGTFLEVWNADQQKWQAFVARGAAGQEQVALLPAEN